MKFRDFLEKAVADVPICVVCKKKDFLTDGGSETRTACDWSLSGLSCLDFEVGLFALQYGGQEILVGLKED